MKKKIIEKGALQPADFARIGQMIADSTSKLSRGTDASINRLDKKIIGLEKHMKEGFDMMDKKIDGIDLRLEAVESKVAVMDRKLDDLAFGKASKEEFYALKLRVDKLEAKPAGI